MNPTLKKNLIEIKKMIETPYYAARVAWPVWYGLLNKKARTQFAKYRPVLTPTEERLVGDFKAHGIAVTTLAELFPHEPNLLHELLEYTKKLSTEAEYNPKKPFILQHWEYFPTISLNNLFVRLSLRPEIFRIVNSYMGMWTKLFYFMLGLTLPSGEGEEARLSQRWHRDQEDKKMCKMFIYLSDVDETSGPFTYVQDSHYGGKWRRFFPQRPPYGYYPPDGSVEKKITTNDIRVCTGKAGTVIFADTSGLHKGGYASKNKRLMYTAGYISSASPGELRYACDDAFLNAMQNLPPEAQYSIRCPSKI